MDEKWDCKSCTYLNYQKSRQCVICSASKGNDENGSIENTKNEINGLKVDNECDINEDVRPVAKVAEESAIGVQGSGDRHEFSQPFKWSCSKCTYENWPKSKCCILCGTLQLQLIASNIEEIGHRPTQKEKHLEQATGEIEQEKAEARQVEEHKGDVEIVEPRHTFLEAESCMASLLSTPTVEMEMVIKEIEIGCDNSLERGKLLKHFGDETQVIRLLGCLEFLDWNWINACISAVHGNVQFIEDYFDNGGDLSRTVSLIDMIVLKYLGNFKVGFTLLHVAVWNNSDIAKCLPTPFVANVNERIVPGTICIKQEKIFRHISNIIELTGGIFPCVQFQEISTFYLPAEIDKLSNKSQSKLWLQLLDHNTHRELEGSVINWDCDVIASGSRLYALWNRTCGDCVLDSVLQCTYGVLDSQNVLRFMLADTLKASADSFYPIWKEDEIFQAKSLGYSLQEKQLAEEWAKLLNEASTPGISLEPFHIFVLAHVLCRPIIIYGDKFIKSLEGDNLGLSRFSGIYLPVLRDSNNCSRSPIALAYTRGHITALVPKEPGLHTKSGKGEDAIFLLPLVEPNGVVLPLQFGPTNEVDEIVKVLKRWLDMDVTSKGTMVAKQVPKLHSLVTEMIYDWLAYYKLTI